MTSRDDGLLAPAAVARVEHRARAVWRTCGVVVVLLGSLVGLLYGFTWAATALAAVVAALVAGGWAWMRTARTLRAAGERVTGSTRGRRSTVRRWSRAVRAGDLSEIHPEEALDMVRWAEAEVVRARLTPYGLGGLLLAMALMQVVNLSLHAPRFAGVGLARVLVVTVLAGLFGTGWWLHQRARARFEDFLDGLDRAGPRP